MATIMAKKPKHHGSMLFTPDYRRRHPHLILPKLLTEKADLFRFDDARLQSGRAALANWADLAAQGALQQNETVLDAEFLRVIFGQALGYKTVSDNPESYTMIKNPTVAGAGIADGSLGFFTTGREFAPTVIIECKDANTDLDHDKFNGRTPVGQLSDYMAQLPLAPWGLLTNYLTIRLYHRDSPMRAYQEFAVADFKNPDKAREFLYLFEPDGLLGHPPLQRARALELLDKSTEQRLTVGDDLYDFYSRERSDLIEELQHTHGQSFKMARCAAQKIIDRIVFVAFCQNCGYIPPNILSGTTFMIPLVSRVPNPRWRNFLDLFEALRGGHKGLQRTGGFEHPLFAHDPTVDSLQLDDSWPLILEKFNAVDFADEVPPELVSAFFAPAVEAMAMAFPEREPCLCGADPHFREAETVARDNLPTP